MADQSPPLRRATVAARAETRAGARERTAGVTRESTELTGIGPRTIAWRTWAPDAAVRLLAPFDPIVWDRRRFELFWGWEYRFEAYTPVHKRRLGYYALPLLWRDRVIGWANVSMKDGDTAVRCGLHWREAAARSERSGASSRQNWTGWPCSWDWENDDEIGPHQLLQGLKLPSPRGPCGRAHQGRHRRRHRARRRQARRVHGLGRRDAGRKEGLAADFRQIRKCLLPSNAR